MNNIKLDHKMINTVYNPMRKLNRKCKCKNCGKAADVDDTFVLTSYPAKYAYSCPECGHHGYCYCSEVWIEDGNDRLDVEIPSLSKTNMDINDLQNEVLKLKISVRSLQKIVERLLNESYNIDVKDLLSHIDSDID